MICNQSDSIGSLYKPCHCNTVIHKECLIKLVDVVNSHQHSCPICLKEYDVKIISKKNLYYCEKQRLMFFILSYSLSISIIVLFGSLFLYYLNNFYICVLLLITGTLSSISPIILVHIFYYKKTGRLCCFSKVVKLKRQLSLPPPIYIHNLNQNIQVV